ncbi:Peroxisome biosynthesis protein pex1 [Microbotryomycetes sp. JL221]|nr:Peroxisome biosynthesis protein pex1 [Microbotryomycetes sp. JL221]
MGRPATTPQSLVVELSLSGNAPKKSATTSKAYVGWTGMPASVAGLTTQVRSGGSAASDRIEMDPQLASMLGPGFIEGAQVTVELMRDLPTATTVNVTPLTADDWEILERNAEFVETHLLNQVRAAKEGMTIGCWVGGKTLVRFAVDSVAPSAKPALLLAADTELIIAPKSRHNAAAAAADKTHDLSAAPDQDRQAPSGLFATPEWERVQKKLVRLLPLDGPWALVASLSTGKPDAQNDIFVSPSLFRSLSKVAPALRIGLHVQKRPNVRLANAEAAAATGPQPEEDRNKDVRPKEIEANIKEVRSIPEDHAWIGDKAREELGLSGDGSFELLRFAAPLSPAAKLAKSKEQSKSSQNLVNGQSTRPTPHRQTTPRSPNAVASTSKLTTPSSSCVSLAGIDEKIEKVKDHVIHSLAARKLAKHSTQDPGIMIVGNSGSGKTALVQHVARELERDPRAVTRSIFIDCSKFSDERHATLKGKIKEWFDEACWHAPSLLVLDNIDRMLSAEVELAHTFFSIATSALSSRPIVLVMTAQSSTSFHPLLSTTHLIGETISLRGPTKAARRDILKALVGHKAEASNLTSKNLNYTNVAGLTEGYLPADLRDLVERAIHQAAIRGTSSAALDLQHEDFVAAQAGFVPLSLRDVKLQKSEVQWADIGGLHETRQTLRETLEWPTKYGAIFASCPLRLRSGLLLYGYPGCGKTLLASAVAKECGLNFISVKGPEILNKYIGASEKSVRDLFERAQAAKPCVLFFDEFDSIAPKRGHDSTGVTDRVVNQMLTQMDGAEGLDGVYVLAATSRPDLIDPALLRPGRLDKSLLCDMPDENDRFEILKACSRKIHLAPSIDLRHLATKTDGYSGADLQAVMYNAHLEAIHETLQGIDTEMTSSSKSKDMQNLTYTTFGGTAANDGKVLSVAEQSVVNKRLELILSALEDAKERKSVDRQSRNNQTESRLTFVQTEHLMKSLTSTRPSVPSDELARLRRIYGEFVDGRSANGLPSGEASDKSTAAKNLQHEGLVM